MIATTTNNNNDNNKSKILHIPTVVIPDVWREDDIISGHCDDNLNVALFMCQWQD